MSRRFTLYGLASAYCAPDFKRLHEPANLEYHQRGNEVTANGSNTTNKLYPYDKIGTVSHWSLSASEWSKFDAILHTPFDYESLNRSDLEPLSPYIPITFRTPYAREEVLAQRLTSTVFDELDRYLRLIDLLHSMGAGRHQYPPGHVPVITEPGSVGFLPRGEFTPDRCTLIATQQEPGGINRCPGDVKCSWKLQASWRFLASPDTQRARRQRNTTMGAEMAMGREYAKVMAQLQYYTQNIGLEPDWNPSPDSLPQYGAKYGYIVTDQEVIVVKRENDPHRPGGRLSATNGFPLRPTTGQNWPRGQMSGMLALLIVRLLASDETDYLFRQTA